MVKSRSTTLAAGGSESTFRNAPLRLMLVMYPSKLRPSPFRIVARRRVWNRGHPRSPISRCRASNAAIPPALRLSSESSAQKPGFGSAVVSETNPMLRTTSRTFGKYSWSPMTRPVRGGRTDRTWIKSLLKDVEVVCTIAPSEAYRTGMTNLGGGGSGWFWCDVGVVIGIHLESVVLPSLDATGVVRESFATRAAAAWRLMKALYRDIEPASSACSSRSNRSTSVSVSRVTIEKVGRASGRGRVESSEDG